MKYIFISLIQILKIWSGNSGKQKIIFYGKWLQKNYCEGIVYTRRVL